MKDEKDLDEKMQKNEILRKELLKEFEQAYYNLLDERILPKTFKLTYEFIINKCFGDKK